MLAQACPINYPSGARIWKGACVTVGVCGESPLGGATVVGSIVAGAASYRAPLHSHVPAVLKLALCGSARKRLVLIPWKVAEECGIDEMRPPPSGFNEDCLLGLLGSRANECWIATIGASSACYNCVLWPERMLHLVMTSVPPRPLRQQCMRQPSVAMDGAEENTRRALYLGFGSYIYDPERPQMLMAALEACRAAPFWQGHFRDAAHNTYSDADHHAFEAWYRDGLVG